MIRRLRKFLSPPMISVVDTLLRLADRPVFLVGGPVRDLLLGRPVLDLDFAVEGETEELSRKLAAALRATLTVHPRFSTAKIVCPDHTAVDLAQTRRERYPEPARLPVVEPGASIVEDLARRDFSIQAMALRLSGPTAGEIVDPYGGLRDLKRRTIRILHPKSFRDDPVRAYRAARYAVRYGFQIEPDTLAQLHRLLRRPDWLTAASDRIMDEWHRTFEEPRWIETVETLRRLNLLDWLGIRSARDTRMLRQVDSIYGKIEMDTPRWAVRWLAFLSLYPASTRLGVAARLPFAKNIKKPFLADVSTGRTINLLKEPSVRPSRIVDALSAVPEEWLVVLAARSGARGRARIRRFRLKWRRVSPPATGDDLRRWGVPPGPVYQKILHKLRAAKLDGRLRGPKDVRRIVSAYLVMK